MKSAEIRARLLKFCDDKLHAVSLSADRYSSKGVRAGLHAGRAVIDSVPVDEDAGRYITSLLEALENERARLDRPDDDDGYSLGGLATVRNEVERLRR